MFMSRDQNVERSYIIKTDNSSFERMETVQIFVNNPNVPKFYSGKNSKQIEVRECSLALGAESFVFHFVNLQ